MAVEEGERRPRVRRERLCISCGRPGVPADPGRTRCEDCRERTMVRHHQLCRRRGARSYRGHDCALCRKHARLVRELHRRWDARDVWVTKRCPKGHRWMKNRQGRTDCPICLNDWLRRVWAKRDREAERRKGARHG